MKCPSCDCPDTVVVDSRPTAGDTAVRRRRRCLVCSHRYTTIETESREAAARAYGNALVQKIADALPALEPRDLELIGQVARRLADDDASALASDLAAYQAFQQRSAA